MGGAHPVTKDFAPGQKIGIGRADSHFRTKALWPRGAETAPGNDRFPPGRKAGIGRADSHFRTKALWPRGAETAPGNKRFCPRSKDRGFFFLSLAWQAKGKRKTHPFRGGSFELLRIGHAPPFDYKALSCAIALWSFLAKKGQGNLTMTELGACVRSGRALHRARSQARPAVGPADLALGFADRELQTVLLALAVERQLHRIAHIQRVHHLLHRLQ